MNRLKMLRLEKNLLQSDIAKIIGVSDRAIGNYENEKRDMSPEIIIKLSNFFGVTTDYLLGKTDTRENINLDDIKIAQSNGLDTEGLSDEELEEVKKQIEYMKWKKNNNK